MQNIFNASEKLFFNTLIIYLSSFIYFTSIPISNGSIIFGFIFSILYFGINFYIGYRYNLKVFEALIVGIIGCSIGIFLSFFAIYSHVVLNLPNFAIWILKPYYISTMSLVKFSSIDINIKYSFYLMGINIVLVLFGSFIKIIMNKLLPRIK